ncbi:hypothetical protein T492DRAFT_856395 [Pavlovales sp. CCMP2436]|nr:hypothetical protein T492DRAFT_856395 [Pavlovales sp. CCMP2436]
MGDPPHVGAQPLINAQLTAGSEAGCQVNVTVVTHGASPFDADNATEPVPVNQTAVEPEAVSVPVVAVLHRCDDNNTDAGDGCNFYCEVEEGWNCHAVNQLYGDIGGLDLCVPTCGDGLRVLGVEPCDDNNTISGDGCSAECELEAGFECSNRTLI